MASGHPLADSDLGTFGIRLSVEVLANQAWDVSLVAGDLLLTHLVGGTSDPVGRVLAAIAENVLEWLVLRGHVGERILLIQSR